MFSIRILDEGKDSGYMGALDIIASRYPETSNFLQSYIWYRFQKSLGKKVFIIGLFFKEVELIGQAVLTEEEIPKVGKFLYCPRGPVLKPTIYDEFPDTAESFYNFIRRFARENKYIFVRIEPPILDKSSEDKPSYLNKFFKKTGFQRSFNKYIQPISTSILRLEPDLETLLKSFHSKTRYNIRLSEKKGIEVEMGGSELIDDFWIAMSETADRNEISIHEQDYYKKQVEIFETVKHFPAEVKIFIARIEDEILAANICIGFHDTFTYLHGGSRNIHRNLMSPYLLQWKQMEYAKESGYAKYDFWGIDRFGDIPKWKGITRFKRGFNGDEISYFPLLDFPIDNFKYKILKLRESLKNKISDARS